MIPILYDPNVDNFQNDGIGALTDAISCVVTEERNGIFELQLTYPVNGIHQEAIVHSSIIKAKANETSSNQLFRVYSISKPINGIITVSAQHISYQLSYIPVKPFTATTATRALNGLKNNAVEDCPFSFWTDITTTANYAQDKPESLRSRLGGQQGSVLDVYGGEYEWDNYTVKLHSHRGEDSGAVLAYGKNITDIEQEESIANTYTGVCPFWESEGDVVMLPEWVLHSDNAQYFPYQRTIPLDLSQEFDSKPTEAQLRSKAKTYINSSNIGIPKVSIKVSFVALWQTEEYKAIAPLERVRLCDYVTIEFPKLNVNAKAEVIRTVYDTLLERYQSLDLGEARSTLAKTIVKQGEMFNNALKQQTSFIDRAITHATDLIKGGLGGYVVMDTNANGEPQQILIMDQPSKESAVNVIRMNRNGIGFSNNGYDGTYKSAWTIDGAFVADFITSGTLRAINIEGVNISGSNLRFGSDPYVQVRTNNAQTGVLFEGTGTVDFETKGMFYAKNFDSSGNRANTLYLTNNATLSSAEMYNYFNNIRRNYIDLEYGTYEGKLRALLGMANYKSTDSLYANRHYMVSSETDSYNQNYLNNFKWSADEVANSLSLRSTTTRDEIALNNYQLGNTNFANYYWAYGQSDQNYMQLSNYKLNSSEFGNLISENVSTTATGIGINNYGFNFNGYANRLSLTSNSSTNILIVSNNIVGSSTNANNITLNSGTNNTLSLANYSANGNLKNSIVLSTNNGMVLRNNVGDTTTQSNAITFNDSGLTISNQYGGEFHAGQNEAWLQYGARKLKFDTTSSTVSARGVQLANDAGGSNYILMRDNGTMEIYAQNGIDIKRVNSIEFLDGSPSLP
ncbi:MAG: phage tail protein [Solobacterium sp.]|nr:phage tail protein [Solobacterium sp.]